VAVPQTKTELDWAVEITASSMVAMHTGKSSFLSGTTRTPTREAPSTKHSSRNESANWSAGTSSAKPQARQFAQQRGKLAPARSGQLDLNPSWGTASGATVPAPATSNCGPCCGRRSDKTDAPFGFTSAVCRLDRPSSCHAWFVSEQLSPSARERLHHSPCALGCELSPVIACTTARQKLAAMIPSAYDARR
jgi:hypothetical protein